MSNDNPTHPMPADLLNQILSELRDIKMEIATSNSRLDRIEFRLDAVEAKQYDTRPIWEKVLTELSGFKKQMHGDLRDISKVIGKHQVDIANLDERVETLEDERKPKN